MMRTKGDSSALFRLISDVALPSWAQGEVSDPCQLISDLALLSAGAKSQMPSRTPDGVIGN